MNASSPLLRVGFFSNNAWPWLRQTPNNDGIFGACQFVFDEQGPFDYVVVYDGYTKNMDVPLPRSRTLFVASEPVNVKRYSPHYTAQFGTLISADPADPHPRKISVQAGLPWHYGILTARPECHSDARRFASLAQDSTAKKTKDISIICSNKDFTPEHRRRLRFVEELKAIMGDRVDVFGRGFREIGDKAEVLDSYRYHVALENCDFADFWTEKIADPFLARAFPFYWGCRNLEDYFPADSFIRLDINNPKEAAEVIRRSVEDHAFEKRQSALEQARQKILYKHNLFALLEREIIRLNKDAANVSAKGRTRLQLDASGQMKSILVHFPRLLGLARRMKRFVKRLLP